LLKILLFFYEQSVIYIELLLYSNITQIFVRFKMDKKVAEHVAEILKAVAHPVRLQIIELLETKEMSVGDIVKTLGVKQSVTSQQLNMMKDKGVLNCRRDGVKVYYRIENKDVIKLLYCVYDHYKTSKH
jgi:DNA-binding transcriptional ArsR family regulator